MLMLAQAWNRSAGPAGGLGVWWIVVIVGWLICAGFAAYAAAERGRSRLGWFVCALLTGPLAVLCALLLPATVKWEARRRAALEGAVEQARRDADAARERTEFEAWRRAEAQRAERAAADELVRRQGTGWEPVPHQVTDRRSVPHAGNAQPPAPSPQPLAPSP